MDFKAMFLWLLGKMKKNKGEEFVEKCSSWIDKTIGDYNDFIRRNGQLHHPIKKNRYYDTFAADYPLKGFLDAASVCLKIEKSQIKKQLLRTRITDFIKRVPGVKYVFKIIRSR